MMISEIYKNMSIYKFNIYEMASKIKLFFHFTAIFV